MCGGARNGVHTFVPHCTLLYNFDPEILLETSYSKIIHTDDGTGQGQLDTNDGQAPDEFKNTIKQRVSGYLLQKCKEIFHKEIFNMSISTEEILLKPEQFYFFPYPKEADNGKGFGCVIPLILLENNPWLQLLHDIVYDIFPPDERHQKDCVDKEDIPNKGKFVPHIALGYVPEVFDSVVNQHVTYLKNDRRSLLESLPLGYLSVWSTEGGVKDWMLVDKVELL